MDRFDRYALYLKAWGRGHTPGNAVGPASAAGSIGVHHHISQRPPLSLDDFDAMFVPLEQGADEVARLRGEVDALERRNLQLECEIGGELKQAKEALGQARRIADDLCAVERAVRVALDAEPSETTPAAARRVVANVSDVGPSERDKRELEDAQVRLRELIAADGKTDTGGRWLYDAAADEIVRLRGEADDDKAALAGAHAELTRLGSEAHMAHEALEQARAKVDELRREVEVDDRLLEHRTLLLDALPCPLHGPCVPHTLQEIARLQAAEKTAREQGAAEMRERAARCVDEMPDEDLAGYAVIHRGKAVDAIGAIPLDGAPAEQQRGVDAAGLEFVDERAERKAARVGEYSTMFMGGRMLPGRPRRSTPEPADELSPEDAEALLASGAWRKSVCGVTWIGPAGGVVDPRTSFGLRGMREAAAELRAKKAPPAAHGEPGKATGGDHAASGMDSVAEEQGAAQGAQRVESPTARVAGLLRRAMWNKTADRLESGEYTPQRARDVLRDWYLNEKTDEDDQKALAALEELARAGQPDAGPNVPVALPKPPRVEVGQRWKHSHDPHTWTVGEVDRHNDDMLATLHTDTGRVVRVVESWLTKGPHWTFLGGPSPQDPSPKRDDATARLDARIGGLIVDVGRTARDPARSSAATADTSEPTARDAVAGMLLRCGFDGWANALTRGASPADAAKQLGSACPVDGVSPKHAACIAALQELARDAVNVHVYGPGVRFRAIRSALGARDGETLEQAARRELDEANRTNAHLGNERRRNIAAVEHLMRSGDEARARHDAARGGARRARVQARRLRRSLRGGEGNSSQEDPCT